MKRTCARTVKSGAGRTVTRGTPRNLRSSDPSGDGRGKDELRGSRWLSRLLRALRAAHVPVALTLFALFAAPLDLSRNEQIDRIFTADASADDHLESGLERAELSGSEREQVFGMVLHDLPVRM